MLDATITAFSALDMQSTVSQGVQRLLSTTQREFPVTDGLGRLKGILTREGMIRALTERSSDTPVVDVMERDVATVSCRAPLSEAVAKLRSGGQPPLVGVVDDDDRVVGIITLENLAEYLMVAQASRTHQHQANLSRRSTVL